MMMTMIENLVILGLVMISINQAGEHVASKGATFFSMERALFHFDQVPVQNFHFDQVHVENYHFDQVPVENMERVKKLKKYSLHDARCNLVKNSSDSKRNSRGYRTGYEHFRHLSNMYILFNAHQNVKIVFLPYVSF